jgi:hypothetical protein
MHAINLGLRAEEMIRVCVYKMSPENRRGETACETHVSISECPASYSRCFVNNKLEDTRKQMIKYKSWNFLEELTKISILDLRSSQWRLKSSVFGDVTPCSPKEYILSSPLGSKGQPAKDPARTRQSAEPRLSWWWLWRGLPSRM